MQIVQLNEKDVIDTLMLLLEHPMGHGDADTINLARDLGPVRGLGLVAYHHNELGKGAGVGPGYS